MNFKWYIGTLLVLLSLLGVNLGPTKVVNQEIVLQFSEAERVSGSVQGDVLAAITAKLQALGITEISVLENDDAVLSIRYYSDIDAAHIQNLLSSNEELPLNFKELDKLPFQFPEDKLPETCSLVVLDLHEAQDVLSLNGKFAFKVQQDYQKFSVTPGTPINTATVSVPKSADEVAYKVNKTIATALDTISFTFPEVRAGPIMAMNS